MAYDGSITLKKIFPCDKRTLFDAWSKPAVMAKWFSGALQPLRDSTVRNSFTVGGDYELIMHLQSGDARMTGRYVEINRYNGIKFTWSSPIVTDSLVELSFREISPNRTELTLHHSLFPSESVRASHNEGWPRCLSNLEKYLEAA